MEKTRFKLLKAPGGYFYRTQLDGKTYRVSSSEIIPGNYIRASYKIAGSRLLLFDIEEVERFDSSFSNASAIRVAYWGGDLETYVVGKDGATALTVEEFGDWQSAEVTPRILLASFVREGERFTYDATRMPVSVLHDFIRKDLKRVIRFFNLGFDGLFFINLLEELGYRQPIYRVDYDDDPHMRALEYTVLQNHLGRIYSIMWNNGENTTTLVDTYNVIPNMSLDTAIATFHVKDYDGNLMKKLDSGGFNRAEWFDESGKVLPKMIDYCENDALASLRLYETFAEDETIKKHFKNRNRFLTIGGVAWRTFLKMSFDPTKKDTDEAIAGFEHYKQGKYIDRGLIAFKSYVGDWSIHHDQHFRKGLYRGGYNLLNNDFYNKVIDKKMYHSDITSAYPWILTSDRLCGKLLKEGKIEEMKFREDRVYIYDIIIHGANLKSDKFPYLINGRKSRFHDSDDNYLTDVDHDISLSVFDFELDRALEVYDNFSYTIIKYYECEAIDGKIFKPFVDHFFNIKEDPDTPKPRRELSKLMLNSLTGKIGENPVRNMLAMNRDEKGVLRTYELDRKPTIGTTRSVPLIANITALLRDYIYSKAEEIGFENVALIATDCLIHIDTGYEFNEESESRQLGKISRTEMKKSIFIGDKMYQFIDKNDEVVTVANGIKKEVQKSLKFGELVPGLKYTVLQKRKTSKGNLLVPVDKEVKERLGGYYGYKEKR